MMALVGLVDQHPDELEFDLRHWFPGTGLRHITGGDLSLRESCAMVFGLLGEPESHTAAALNGWSAPMSKSGLILADIFDLMQVPIAGRRIKETKSYPRVWDEDVMSSSAPQISAEMREQSIALLESKKPPRPA